METLTNAGTPSRNGTPAAAVANPRCPRRIVLLAQDERSEVAEVLREYGSAEVSGKRLHTELQRLACLHRGRCVAAEWLGPRGWTRFLWGQRS